MAHPGKTTCSMNPFDALLVPPALVKRALDDLHDIATLARRYTGMEPDIRARVDRAEAALLATRDELATVRAEIVRVREGIELLDELLAGTRGAVAPLSAQIAHMEGQLDGLVAELAPIRNLEPIRRGIEPLEHSMVAVRESVDELEPKIADLDEKIRGIDPKLDEMQESIEPIGDLAEKIPGNRRRRGG
jgi:phage shock protein A